MKFSSISEMYKSDDDGLAPFDYDDKLYKDMQKINGWRGLFDYGSHEFNQNSILEKWAIIERLKKFADCDLNDLVHLFIKEYITREDIFDSVSFAIMEYAKHFPEADHYMNHQHALFSRYRLMLIPFTNSFAHSPVSHTKSGPSISMNITDLKIIKLPFPRPTYSKTICERLLEDRSSRELLIDIFNYLKGLNVEYHTDRSNRSDRC